MSELISGKEAKLAWANGLEVEFYSNILDRWVGLSEEPFLSNVFEVKDKFRLKPITISVNGKSIAKPYLASRDGKKIEIEFYSETNAHDFIEALRNAS